MIGNPKPIASLSSGLLARKGQARPAMRPQGFLQLGAGNAQEDLGWNDMGEGEAPVAKPVVLQQRAALDERLAAPETVVPEPPAAEVPVEAPAPEPAPAKAALPEPAPTEALPELTPISDGVIARVVRAVAPKKAKAAFTLRLDPDRHLKLRLAAAVTHRSCQHLVTEALDQFLESIGEVDALARQLAPKDRG